MIIQEALKDINNCYKQFRFKGKPVSKRQAIKILKYGQSKGILTIQGIEEKITVSELAEVIKKEAK